MLVKIFKYALKKMVSTIKLIITTLLLYKEKENNDVLFGPYNYTNLSAKCVSAEWHVFTHVL